MKKIIRLLLILFPILVIGQTQTQNYIKTVTYKTPVQQAIIAPTISQASQNTTYFDGLGRPVQQIAGQQSATGKDIITHIKYDDFGRQAEEYLPFKSANTNMAFDPGAEANVLSYYSTPNPTVNGNPSAEATTNPFSRKELEASPLNRVLKQAAPGDDWKSGSGHEIKMDYQANVANEVKLFTANALWDSSLALFNISLSNNGFYNASELYKNITYDENTAAAPTETDGSTVEFKNKEGQVILKRTYGTVGNGTANEKHDTYYVYDIYGNLTYVISPKAVDILNVTNIQSNITSTAVVNSGSSLQLTATNSIVLSPGFNAISGSTFSAIIDNSTQNTLDNLCYQYKYDDQNRLVEKKLPGKGWEYIVYDKLDRPILTQDANLKTFNKWLFTKYDAFSRPVYTGEYINTVKTTRADVQLLADAGTTLSETKQTVNTINGTTVYYSNTAFPNTTDINLLTINYYDNYDFDLNGGGSAISYTITPITNAKGLATGKKVRVLGTSSWITSLTYYDAKGRPIYSYSKNDYLATTSTVKSQLDFVGKTLETTSTHLRNGVTTSIVDAFTYDQAGRLTKQTQAINGAATPEVIVANTYDELGQLTSKKVGGKTTQGLQTVDYTYNIRGWLKSINDPNNLNQDNDLFGFGLNYNTIVNPSLPNSPLYNGNISSTSWKTNNGNPVLKQYNYTYDVLNRFRSSDYIENNVSNSKFDEVINGYDRNGNMIDIYRSMQNPNDTNSFTSIDYLTYTYNGNQLMKVDDVLKNSTFGDEGFKDGTNTDNDYSYDANGNMILDKNKGITSITYNHLNLPITITFATGTIDYKYDATGVKQRKIVSSGVTTDYADGFQYENNILKFFPQPEGYVQYNSGIFSYIYQYKDHLGNVHLSYSDSNNDGTIATSEILEENNYYPFGLKHKDSNNVINSTNPGLKYKYNGKELQDELGLGMYAMDARQYDPAIGRWIVNDPIVHHSTSPYSAFEGNPIFWADPSGAEGEHYDYNKGGYVNSKGQSVSFSEAMASQGLNTDGSKKSTEPDDWIKNNETGEVKWFDGTSKEAQASADKYWGFFNNKGKTNNLGTSFFGTKTNNILDNSQISEQQYAYLLEVSLKINKEAGVQNDLFFNNNITLEYLSSKFLGTAFGTTPNKGSDLPGLVWDYGGSDYVARKLPYTLVKGGLFVLDLALSSQGTGVTADRSSNVRTQAVNYFKTSTMNYLNQKTLTKINLHKF